MSRTPAGQSGGVTRRQVLETLGALAAAGACGGAEEPLDGGAAGSSGLSGSAGSLAGGGSGGSAGTGAGKGGSSSGSGGVESAGTAGTGGAGSSGAAGSPAGGAGSGGEAGAQPTAGNGGSGAGGSAGGGEGGLSSGGNAGGVGGSSAGGGAGGAGGELTPPPFDDVPMCTASRTDAAGQGPFFIHDKESHGDVSLFRQDIRGRYHEDAASGVEMQLHLRILDATSSSCNGAPVPDVDVYIWHTDGQGYYSGFGTRGSANEQKPDQRYSGLPGQNDLDTEERFCRGAQTTNADGVVSFRSIFPGWYNGRDVHIHVLVLKRDSASRGRVSYTQQNSENQWLFTTQFYFEPELTASVHEAYEPYKARTTGALASAYQGAILADETNNSGLRAKASLAGDVVTAQMQILLNPA